MFYTYVLQCADGSYYTGFAAHLCRRMREHTEQSARCAKYTRSHPVTALAALWKSDSRSKACRLEAQLKKLTHAQKTLLFAAPARLDEFLGDALSAADYENCPGVTLPDCLSGAFEEEKA